MHSNIPPYTPLEKIEVDRIDALRGFLCTAVFTFHYLTGLLQGAEGTPLFFKQIGKYGSLSVQVFFALSGFLLFHSYSRSLLIPGRRVNLAFYTKRFFRIYPVWALILFLFAYKHSADIEAYFSNLFFLFALRPFKFNEVLAFHSWSIYVEEIFYFCFPFFIFFYRKGLAPYGLALFFALSFVVKKSIHVPDGYFYFHPFNTFQYFFFGMVMYCFLPTFRKIKVSRIFFYLLLAFVILISFTNAVTLVIWSYILFSFLILFAAPKEFSAPFLFTFRRLGLTCYSFYLIHPLCQMAVGKFLQPTSPGPLIFWEPATAIKFVLSYSLTVVAAVLIYFVVEKPFIRLGKNMINKSSLYMCLN